MQIEFIYTFESGPQKVAIHPFVLPILQDKETLIEFALSELLDEEKTDLLKISSCVYLYGKKDVELPDWFNDVNGKLWF